MELMALPLLWAQNQPGGGNPNPIAALALRRWCSSLTLSSPQMTPSLHGLWAFLAALGVLLVVAIIAQGPSTALKQFVDVPGHVRLVRTATRRVWRAGRVVSITIGFTVVAWTGSQSWVFKQESGKLDLVHLAKSRGLGELAVEQGILAGLTPLRDVAGLGDNLPLLIIAAIVVFKATVEPQVRGYRPTPGQVDTGLRPHSRSGWSTLVWGSASLYALYRIVARFAGSVELPLGGCLVVEAVFIPVLMAISDGFLLAWILTELRNAGFDDTGDDRLDALQAIALMPGTALACVLALPARYMATFVLLASIHLPTSVGATSVGRWIRWQLGWGLTDLQAAALVVVGLAGAVAWSRGTIRGALSGYRLLLAAEAGHLIVVLAMAGAAASLLAAGAYAVVLLLPVQTWVLAAADSYAHFATLPVSLWTLAAFIELAERSLPLAARARPAAGQASAGASADGSSAPLPDVLPPVVAPRA
jgi:hypothetical protein